MTKNENYTGKISACNEEARTLVATLLEKFCKSATKTLLLPGSIEDVAYNWMVILKERYNLKD